MVMADDDEAVEVELTPDLALAQASNTLLLATEKAEYANDVAALMKIAGGWMEIHEYLTGQPHHNKKQPLGFVGSTSNETQQEQLNNEEEGEEELDDAISDDGGTESKYLGRLHPQHGKLRITPSRYRD